jgi:hypothetical protein
MRNIMIFLIGLHFTNTAAADTANLWTKLDKATIVGRRWDVPLGYAPSLKQFIILGGRSSYADYRKLPSYDVLTLHPGASAAMNHLARRLREDRA